MGLCLFIPPMSNPFNTLCTLLVLLFLWTPALGQTVYITKTGEKYHRDSCRYLSKSKISTNLSEAVENDYSPCSICDPPTKGTTASPKKSQLSQPSKTQTVTSRQCSTTTKAGARCKRMTTNGNGRCWQHQWQETFPQTHRTYIQSLIQRHEKPYVLLNWFLCKASSILTRS